MSEENEGIIKLNGENMFSKTAQAESLYLRNPFFYDDSGIFRLWDNKKKFWKEVDEIDLLNAITDSLGIYVIKEKQEILTALKMVGRKKKPKPLKSTWVQMGDMIYDFANGESFQATPQLFAKNPIPYEPSDCQDTPVMDKLFEEWVGKENVIDLYETLAYSSSPSQFLQILIALLGGGSNGKGTFSKIGTKWLGGNNVTSSELRILTSPTTRFETYATYGKLAVYLGEVSWDDLKNTNQLKKLTGEDLIRYEPKGKKPFSEESPATLIILSNSLPYTPDRSIGFYRRWVIIDFPNEFTGDRDPLKEIPEEEYNNLSRKVLSILSRLWKTRKFTNSGDFEERKKKYEQKSNPLESFVVETCQEVPGSFIPLREFSIVYNNYLKKNKLRSLSVVEIGKQLRFEGYEIGTRKVKESGTETSVKAIKNLTFELEEKPQEVIKVVEKKEEIDEDLSYE